MSIIPIILCGGYGKRLRSELPKQFLKISNTYTLLQTTLLRTSQFSHFAKPIIMANLNYLDYVLHNIEEINFPYENILLESESKNTGPAVASAALFLKNKFQDKNPNILILPIDHYIEDDFAFIKAISNFANIDFANNKIATLTLQALTIQPNYGYIIKGSKIDNNICKVARFIEKPSEKLIYKLSQNQQLYWNSGIYFTTLNNLIESIKYYANRIYELALNAVCYGYFLEPKHFLLSCKYFSFNHNISIDKCLINKHHNLITCDLLTNWGDLGMIESVKSLYKSNYI